LKCTLLFVLHAGGTSTDQHEPAGFHVREMPCHDW